MIIKVSSDYRKGIMLKFINLVKGKERERRGEVAIFFFFFPFFFLFGIIILKKELSVTKMNVEI